MIGCKVEGCERPHHGRGYCGLHYRRWRLHGDPGPVEMYPEARLENCLLCYEIDFLIGTDSPENLAQRLGWKGDPVGAREAMYRHLRRHNRRDLADRMIERSQGAYA